MKQSYIGENIRIYRERANLTQQELADKVGITWEMISRYERDESMPYKKLENISKALDVSKSQLLEKHTPERYSTMQYKIPLFVKLPKSCKFHPTQTNYFYICPEWILQRDRDCIAIDTSLIINDESPFSRDGVVYVSINIKPEIDDYILIKQNKGLVIDRYKGDNSNVLGKILAQEIRY
ncbi:helix-turn-helix transcriptional regulator [Candidatus Dojkabacteria bacterium]|uniref:Helix-turn-helix transcriptional regulator n=1 Tax=Candidatus Dojkabacteria bacterium TaxID=2099670 RepID=A0A847VEF8_9BACT|nr:helix-turn-helix transcriptional regulator [Candidatus Dojkabacteria bacterium]